MYHAPPPIQNIPPYMGSSRYPIPPPPMMPPYYNGQYGPNPTPNPPKEGETIPTKHPDTSISQPPPNPHHNNPFYSHLNPPNPANSSIQPNHPSTIPPVLNQSMPHHNIPPGQHSYSHYYPPYMYPNHSLHGQHMPPSGTIPSEAGLRG